ncbi:hypothetical protein UFOVP1616_34 [uncultured Caudovirales phage]|uniref:Uncharacterized protein n=1 Tax=uncultured Caudovirales phage TaxID=2100421 RepID=A0A6J5SKD2_9CAUD|nr:hypothetical protein UFOVP1467_50 [uncultured Caudovirales phage]CAB4219653.1 hypothetical protein UFOVP1616_34 [uncultured Caudovirales phage]
MTTAMMYPCDRGTGMPSGWHNFEGKNGIICCTWCGAVPK